MFNPIRVFKNHKEKHEATMKIIPPIEYDKIWLSSPLINCDIIAVEMTIAKRI